MRAALRLGAFQLVFLDGVPRYAAVNESVELVRRSRLERAVPFTNAVLRRLAEEGRTLVEGLPESTPEEAALRHSYPDWVAETWWRDLGSDGALALMRAQNEAPPTVVRLVRGEIEGVPDADVPGAWHVEHVDERMLEDGRVWLDVVNSLVWLAISAMIWLDILRPVAAESPAHRRRSIIKLALREGLGVREQIIPREMLYIADEVFFTGTAAELTPVRSVDRIKVGAGKVGPVTKHLQTAFLDIANGRAPDTFGWLTPVR